MARTKIDIPVTAFSCLVPVRITDINYGGHVGNDTVLSILHEARMQFLASLGYTEMKFAGNGMIMADVTIEFKAELFYGDTVIASVVPGEIFKVGFELLYRLETQREYDAPAGGRKILVAVAKTRMICYDYEKKKIVGLADEAKMKLMGV